MYIFKNAFISITRNKGRNLLIGIIIIVISCATAVTLAIKNSATSLIDSYENKYDVTATIGINRESMRGEMQHGEDASDEDRENSKQNMMDIFSSVSNISTNDIDNYGDSKYVKDYYYKKSVGVDSSELEQASNTESDSSNASSRGGKQSFMNQSNSDFTLSGYSSISGMEDFINGKYEITSGEVVEDNSGDNCVINSELATLNDIEVGDEITFVDPDNDDNTVKLKVTGIFEETSDTTDAMGMFTSSVNTIITNTSVIEKLTDTNEDMKVTTTPTFVLTSKDVIDKFEDEIREKRIERIFISIY